MSLAVKSKTHDTVKCVVVDGGELKSRRHLNVRGKSATLPSITGNTECWCCYGVFVFHLLYFGVSKEVYKLGTWSFTFVLCTDKDWEDIKFGVDNQVDFYAVSFVKDARVVHELKDYLKSEFLIYVFIY